MQNPTQRGFTKGSFPMNAALPVEEAYRILTDEKQNGHLVLLDAKAAFDKVIHSHLFSLNIFYLLKCAKRIRHKLNKLMKSSPIYNKLQHYLIEHACI